MPGAENTSDVVDAPVVAVHGDQILVDGVTAGSVRDVEEIGRLGTIAELGALLRAKRALWKAVQPDRPFPGVCILQIDEGASAVVVKSVFHTVASAGYSNVSFLVHKLAAR